MGHRARARPRHHAQAEGAIEDFKKSSQRAWISRARKGDRRRQDRNLVPGRARFGQKNKITRRWAKRGTRPSAPRDQRTASTYIFGAICPNRVRRGSDPACLHTEAMTCTSHRQAVAQSPRRPPPRQADGICQQDCSFPSTSPFSPSAESRTQSLKHLAVHRDNSLSNRIFNPTTISRSLLPRLSSHRP